LRQKYPQRWSLRDRLRYLLNHQAGLALWETADGEWLCGFAAWRDQKKAVAPDVSGLSDPRAFGKNVQRMKLADLVTAIFNDVGSPVELDGLVNVVAELLDVKDPTSQTMMENENEKSPLLEDVPAAALEMSVDELSALWNSLPLDEDAIARRFHLNCASVPKWRQRARERLGRSLAEREREH
jgi:hypothetical protein